MSGNAGSAALAGNPGGGGAPAGDQGGQGGGAPAGDQGGAPAGGGEKPWFETAGIDAKYAPAIAAKGWTNLNDILESYTNVEKLVSLERGGDVDRILVKPKADATPEEIAAFRAKAGFAAPADIAEYGFTPESVQTTATDLFTAAGLPVEMSQAFAAEMTPVVEAAAGWMKEAGAPKDVAAGLVQQVLGREVAALKEFHTKSHQEYTALEQELGDKFADFEESGRRAFRASGIDKAVLDKIELAIGTKAMLTMFGKFGQAMTEASAPQPGKQGGASQFTQTADQAKQRIDMLRRDSDFQAKLRSPNPEVRKAANAEWEGLFKTAYPS